jgi:hypothetical protein
MGEASPRGPTRPPRDLSAARGTTGLGDPGSYLFVESMGQQGLEPCFGFTPPVMGNQGLSQANGMGTKETGALGQWASPTMGTGIIGFGLVPPAMGNQGFGQATALGAMETGGPGSWASPAMGTGVNFAGVQGILGDPCLPPPTGLPPAGVQPIAPGTGLVTAPGAYVPAGMPLASAGIGVITGMGFPPVGTGTGGTGGHGQAGQPPMRLGGARGILQHQDLPRKAGGCAPQAGFDYSACVMATGHLGGLWHNKHIHGEGGEPPYILQAFLMIREGSVMVTTVHSIAKFFSLSAAMSRYQGRYIRFVGDGLWVTGSLHANRDKSSSRQQKLGLDQENGLGQR